MSFVSEIVKDIIVEHLNIDEEYVVPGASFQYDLNVDSLDCVELIMKFEDEFSITIPDEDAENFKTVKDVTDYIELHLNGNSPSPIGGEYWTYDKYGTPAALYELIDKSSGQTGKDKESNYSNKHGDVTYKLAWAGYNVRFVWTETNGIINVDPNAVFSSIIGISLWINWVQGTVAVKVTGKIIELSVMGNQEYNLLFKDVGRLFTQKVTINLTYDTTNGEYTIGY